jgi:hypothetical protein
MPQFRFLAALLFAGALACSASEASASVLIQIDKRAQTMTVAVDGQLRYRWPVSTGATGFSTLHAVPHGSDALFPGMGQRRHAARDFLHHERAQHPWLGPSWPWHAVSHGCVRLTLSNATTLYQLVQRTACRKPKSWSEGLIHRASRSRASRRDSGRGSGDHFNFSSSRASPLA